MRAGCGEQAQPCPSLSGTVQVVAKPEPGAGLGPGGSDLQGLSCLECQGQESPRCLSVVTPTPRLPHAGPQNLQRGEGRGRGAPPPTWCQRPEVPSPGSLSLAQI